MMLPRDLLQLSLHNLLLHKVRSILTSLGVIFGVGSVIAMLAISEGAKRKALSQIEAMGIDKILVYAKKPSVEGTGENAEETGTTERYGLTSRDLVHIRQMDNVERVTLMHDTRQKVRKGVDRMDLKLVAVGYRFLLDSNSRIEQGRWLSPADYKQQSMVCVIGQNVKRKLFNLGQTDIVGSVLRIGQQVFTIVGILHNDNGTQYPELGSPNDMIFIPTTTSDAVFGSYSFTMFGRQTRVTLVDYDLFIVTTHEIMHIDDTSKRISAYLQKTHDKVRDWDVLVPLDLLKQREATQNIFTIVMSSIASISLIVGGIGIMNIMLASVYERRKEIGTRRALGAQKSDILVQFLIETVTLTSLGGMLGVVMGIGISQLITLYADMPTVYSIWSIVASLLISSLVGVIFGTYPAWKAAQQNPITVLRAE